MNKSIIVISILILAGILFLGWALLKSSSLDNNFPIQGIDSVNNDELIQISNLLTKDFYNQTKSPGCDKNNSRIFLLVNSVEGNSQSDLIGARLECKCGVNCVYDVSYNLEKINNKWKINSRYIAVT